jgi:parallel beta-helix repeat protein
VVEYNHFEKLSREVTEIKSSYNVLRYNTFIDIAGGISLRNGHHNVVEGNLLQGASIAVKGENHTVINNVISDTDIGIGLRAWGQLELLNGRISEFPPTGKNLIANNTIVNCSNAAIDLGRSAGYPGLKKADGPPYDNQFINNIFVGKQGTLFNVISQTGTVIRNNLYWTTQTAQTGETGLSPIIADPKFATGTYTLSPNSAAINQGLAVQGLVTDHDQKQRDSRPDIGAYEAQM